MKDRIRTLDGRALQCDGLCARALPGRAWVRCVGVGVAGEAGVAGVAGERRRRNHESLAVRCGSEKRAIPGPSWPEPFQSRPEPASSPIFRAAIRPKLQLKMKLPTRTSAWASNAGNAASYVTSRTLRSQTVALYY